MERTEQKKALGSDRREGESRSSRQKQSRARAGFGVSPHGPCLVPGDGPASTLGRPEVWVRGPESPIPVSGNDGSSLWYRQKVGGLHNRPPKDENGSFAKQVSLPISAPQVFSPVPSTSTQTLDPLPHCQWQCHSPRSYLSLMRALPYARGDVERRVAIASLSVYTE